MLTGVAAGLGAGRKVAGATGAFVLTGKASTLSAQRRFPAAPGAFTLNGVAATLRHGARLLATPGAFILTGYEALLSGSSTLVGGGTVDRTFTATFRQDRFLGARREDTFSIVVDSRENVFSGRQGPATFGGQMRSATFRSKR